MTDPETGQPINPIAQAVANANNLGGGSDEEPMIEPRDFAGAMPMPMAMSMAQPEPQPERKLTPPAANPAQPQPQVVVVEKKKGRGMGCFAMLALCTLILTAGGVAVYYLTANSIWKFGAGLARISENFLNENITQTFIAAHMDAESSSSLETAKAEVRETFTDFRNWRFFDWNIFGTGINTKLSVPATYRYHVDLNGAWDLAQVGSTCVVVAPQVQPTLPVAFDSAGMEWDVKTGSWLRDLDSDAGRRKLEPTITQQLKGRASSEEALENVREPSRVSIANFVKNWLKSEDQWRRGGFTEIKVMFPDEVDTKHPDEMPATLVLNKKPMIKVPFLE